jgi:NADH-quinone oxidoreductase subunit G
MSAPVSSPPALLNVTIDGIQVQVPPGTSIIEAAKQAGTLVPHYCYHPSLPSPAVCRMCLVEVEKFPKLVPACVTTVAEGQVVHTQSASAKKAREGVLEFLLINHPLDCPICDQAGECELQDYVFQEGRAGTRYANEAKRYNPAEDFGPDIMYVGNRCILCTRCVRFMDHVAGEKVLNVSERGDRAYIGIDASKQLDHPWAGNVVDLCPVGSLISKDFLHKARAWDLDRTASVCPGCSQGCNISIDTRDDTVVRFRPRANLEVNRHFICDTGRAGYRFLNRGDRLEAPLVRSDSGQLVVADWDVALAAASAVLRSATGSAVILASGRASAEALGHVQRLTSHLATIAVVQVPMGTEAPLGGVPNLALRAERAPNGRGAEMLGYGTDVDAAIDRAAQASVVILLDADLDADQEARLAGLGGALLVIATVPPEGLRDAVVMLPTTTMAEEQGVYVNRDGRAQRYSQAKAAPALARPAWWIAAEIAGCGDDDADVPVDASDAFRMLPEFGGLRHADLGWVGRVVAG